MHITTVSSSPFIPALAAAYLHPDHAPAVRGFLEAKKTGVATGHPPSYLPDPLELHLVLIGPMETDLLTQSRCNPHCLSLDIGLSKPTLLRERPQPTLTNVELAEEGIDLRTGTASKSLNLNCRKNLHIALLGLPQVERLDFPVETDFRTYYRMEGSILQAYCHPRESGDPVF